MYVGVLDKVPAISPRVDPNHNAPVRLITRSRFENNAFSLHAQEVLLEVGSLQKEPNPTAALLADGRMLTITNCAREQDLGFAAAWGNPYPTLSVSQIGIFTALEPDAQEKRQSFIVVGDKKRK